MQPAACSLYMPVYASGMAGALQERASLTCSYTGFPSWLALQPRPPWPTPGESLGREFRISTKSHSLS